MHKHKSNTFGRCPYASSAVFSKFRVFGLEVVHEASMVGVVHFHKRHTPPFFFGDDGLDARSMDQKGVVQDVEVVPSQAELVTLSCGKKKGGKAKRNHLL